MVDFVQSESEDCFVYKASSPKEARELKTFILKNLSKHYSNIRCKAILSEVKVAFDELKDVNPKKKE